MHINLQVQSIKSFQIAFAIFSLLTAILCLIVLLAPGWVNVTAQGARVDIEKQETFQYNFEVNLGLFGFACTQKDLRINGQSNPSGLTIRVEICREWAEKRIPLETVESILLIFVILFSLASFCWDLLLLFGKFTDWNKARLFLAPLATMGTLLLAITFILYWTGGCNANEGILAGWRNAKCSLGFNFFIAAAALISSFLAFISGLIIVALNRRLLRGSNYWN